MVSLDGKEEVSAEEVADVVSEEEAEELGRAVAKQLDDRGVLQLLTKIRASSGRLIAQE